MRLTHLSDYSALASGVEQRIAGPQQRHRPALILKAARTVVFSGQAIGVRARCDNHYIESWSVWLDVKL
jgi:hypothetical protein